MKPRPRSMRAPPAPEPLPMPPAVRIAQATFAAVVIAAMVVFCALLLRLGPCDYHEIRDRQPQEALP